MFETLYPNDSRSYVATTLHELVKSLVDADVWSDDLTTRRAELDVAENRALSASDALVAKFPNSPQYDAFRIVVRYCFAKREALVGALERADELLSQADEQIVEFAKKRPNFDDFQFFVPLRAARAELLVALGRLDDAETYVAKLERALGRAEKNDDETANARTLRQTIDRLRRLLDEARAAAPTLDEKSEPNAS